MAKPKLLKKHYVEIIERTIAGETRSSIAMEMPVDVRRICRIVCDFADGTESENLNSLLADVLTDDVRQKLSERCRIGRSRKLRFLEHAETVARDDAEFKRMVEAWEHGYSTGYNKGRQKLKAGAQE